MPHQPLLCAAVAVAYLVAALAPCPTRAELAGAPRDAQPIHAVPPAPASQAGSHAGHHGEPHTEPAAAGHHGGDHSAPHAQDPGGHGGRGGHATAPHDHGHGEDEREASSPTSHPEIAPVCPCGCDDAPAGVLSGRLGPALLCAAGALCLPAPDPAAGEAPVRWSGRAIAPAEPVPIPA